MATASNEVVGGLYGLAILIITAFIIFVTMRGYDTKTVAMATMSFTSIIALILYTPLQLIGGEIFSGVVALTIATILVVVFTKE